MLIWAGYTVSNRADLVEPEMPLTLVSLGWNQGMQDSVRDKAGYRGKLFEDVFADPRLNLQPPSVATMALLFCHNHNWIAEKLLIESKDDFRFATIPDKGDEKELIRLDEHLFQLPGISTSKPSSPQCCTIMSECYLVLTEKTRPGLYLSLLT